MSVFCLIAAASIVEYFVASLLSIDSDQILAMGAHAIEGFGPAADDNGDDWAITNSASVNGIVMNEYKIVHWVTKRRPGFVNETSTQEQFNKEDTI